MIWHKTDIYTISIVEDTGLGGTYFTPVIKWANRNEKGPKVRTARRASAWAARRVCNRLGDAAIDLVDREGEEVLTW